MHSEVFWLKPFFACLWTACSVDFDFAAKKPRRKERRCLQEVENGQDREIIFKTAWLIGMGRYQGLVCIAHTNVEPPDV